MERVHPACHWEGPLPPDPHRRLKRFFFALIFFASLIYGIVNFGR